MSKLVSINVGHLMGEVILCKNEEHSKIVGFSIGISEPVVRRHSDYPSFIYKPLTKTA